jgi:hypothetical protein
VRTLLGCCSLWLVLSSRAMFVWMSSRKELVKFACALAGRREEEKEHRRRYVLK